MKDFIPEGQHGVLFDADGRCVFRFGNFEVGRTYQVPDYVETDRQPEYANNPTPGEDLNRPLEAHPDAPELPDPAEPADKNPVKEFQ